MKLLKDYKGGLQTTVNTSFGDAYIIEDEEFIIMITRKKKVDWVKIFIKNYDHPDPYYKYPHRCAEYKYVNGMKEALLYIKTLFSPIDYIEVQKKIVYQL